MTRLDLDNNSLSSLPASIGQLTNLSVLDLRGNSLSSLPASIGQLTNLSVLYLSDNSLSSLPAEIGQLTNLSVFDLRGNSLSSLPAEITQLYNLSKLYLSDNFLSSLPAEIGQLTNLTRLDLDNNSLSSLPAEITQLYNLSVLDLNGNSLPIPPEVIGKYDEPETILNYYFSLQNNQKKPLHEAKMLLVGQGNVGKTCVRERLMRNEYYPTRNKTDGIDIEPWKIKINQNNYQINVWDFGGQEIMHSTHQFFLTKRSLYLLVIDTTIGEEENRIEYWLKIIQSFGKDSPVIIVGNKADQHPLDIDQRALQNKYPQIKGFYEISCQTPTGIEELKVKVIQEIIQLEHIDDQLPLPWFKVKQKLEDLDKDFIPYHQYEKICESEEIDREDNQRILIKLLNDLGIVLNFHDDPRLEDTHVLNPKWVTNGVYKILNDYQLIVDHKGILESTMLRRILNRQRYPTSKHLFIIDMMRKFELCFNIETDKKFLIPDIVPKGEPDTGEWQNTLAFEYHYPVLPGSIISRFIVRMNQWISQQTYWRSGVVLAQEGNRALVKADREDKKIIIRINGKESTRRNLLTAIRSQFDHIHATIPGIVPEEKVPLLDYPNIPPVDYQWLRVHPNFVIGRKAHI
ncbi:MAG: COR domain-containing protein [Cyanobacteria bacterium P01_G01_bin.39]